MAVISFIPENDAEFKRALDKLGEACSDFRIPFNLISNDWYRSNRQIFSLKSKGLYTDLQPSTKERHLKWNNAIYPILVGKTGRLAASLLTRTHRDSIFFSGKKYMEMGTRTPYAIYHQSDEGRKRLSQSQLGKRLATMAGINQKINVNLSNISNKKLRKIAEKKTSKLTTSWESGMENLLPQRKLVFISGGPSERSRGDSTNGRLERWIKIIENYINKTIKDKGF